MLYNDRMKAELMSDRKLRIAVICSHTISLVNFRFELLRAMIDNGHAVIGMGPEYDDATVRKLDSIGVRFVQIPMTRTGLNPAQDLRTIFMLWRKVRTVRPDVVLAYTMKPIIYGLIAARLAGIRERHALVTGLGYVFSDAGNDRKRIYIRRLATWLYRLAFAGNGRVFVYNHADAEDIVDGRMIRDKSRLVFVAGSGVDLGRFAATDVPEGQPVFLLVARLLREKGLGEFADAARLLRERGLQARFQILGPPDPSPLAIPVSEVARWPGIEYLGETSDVRPFLRNCSVFVLPSYYREGIPRSILEAMATGRAIVTTDRPGCRDTVLDGQNGILIPPRDSAALADALARFISDPGLARRMGACSYKLAQERFDSRLVNHALLDSMQMTRRRDVP